MNCFFVTSAFDDDDRFRNTGNKVLLYLEWLINRNTKQRLFVNLEQMPLHFPAMAKPESDNGRIQ